MRAERGIPRRTQASSGRSAAIGCRFAIVIGFVCLALCPGWAQDAAAQGVDFTVFVGRAYPVYDERLTLRPSAPSIPGLRVVGQPEIRADGGPVFGAAVTFEVGVLGIEGRVDATEVGFDLQGVTYELSGAPSFPGFQVTFGDGRLEADRLYLLSGNLRLRTPGPVGLVVSGGVSLLPRIAITGSVPLSARLGDFSPPPLDLRLRLRAAPGEPEHRIGVNAGAGLRIGAGPVAIQAEVRGFYFREHELRFQAEPAPALVQMLLDEIGPVRFEPVIVNAQAGIVFRF